MSGPWSHVGMVLKHTGDSRVLPIEAPAGDTLRIIDLRDYAIPGSQPGSQPRHAAAYHGQSVLARPLAFVSARRRRMRAAEAEKIRQMNGATDSRPLPTPQRTRRLPVTQQSHARKVQQQDVYTCAELVAALLRLHDPHAAVLSDGLQGEGFITPGDLAEQIPHAIIARMGT